MEVFEACGEEGEKGRQMLLFSATMPPWVDKVCVRERRRERAKGRTPIGRQVVLRVGDRSQNEKISRSTSWGSTATEVLAYVVVD